MTKAIVTARHKLSFDCKEVTLKDIEYVKEIVSELVLAATQLGNRMAGLAANQLGYDARIILVDLSDGYIIMINPELNYRKGKIVSGKEGCFSVPSTLTNSPMVRRHYKIEVSFVNVRGKFESRKLKGHYARVVQHEIDHLNGILIA